MKVTRSKLSGTSRTTASSTLAWSLERSLLAAEDCAVRHWPAAGLARVAARGLAGAVWAAGAALAIGAWLFSAR